MAVLTKTETYEARANAVLDYIGDQKQKFFLHYIEHRIDEIELSHADFTAVKRTFPFGDAGRFWYDVETNHWMIHGIPVRYRRHEAEGIEFFHKLRHLS